MRKLTKYKINKINKNLDFLFNFATKKEIINGKNWYIDANKEMLKISNKYDVDVFLVSSVCSALSPRNKWIQNIKDTEKVVKAFRNGIDPENIKVCTFHTNKFKAFNILKKQVKINNNSLKTYNFVNNIAFLSSEHLTVDIWHLRGCFLNDIKINNASIGKIAYEQIKRLTIKKADKLGLKGYEFQAIIWLSAQRYFTDLR